MTEIFPQHALSLRERLWLCFIPDAAHFLGSTVTVPRIKANAHQ